MTSQFSRHSRHLFRVHLNHLNLMEHLDQLPVGLTLLALPLTRNLTLSQSGSAMAVSSTFAFDDSSVLMASALKTFSMLTSLVQRREHVPFALKPQSVSSDIQAASFLVLVA